MLVIESLVELKASLLYYAKKIVQDMQIYFLPKYDIHVKGELST